MISRQLMDSLAYLDDDLLLRAEKRTKATRTPRRKLTLLAACAAMLAAVCLTAAAGLSGGLESYFNGPGTPLPEEFLWAQGEVSNEELTLRIDGAVADGHACHLLVSVIGRTGEMSRRLQSGNLAEQELFDLYGLRDGQRVAPTSWESTAHLDTTGAVKTAVTQMEGADMTWLLTFRFLQDETLAELDAVCFSYQGLTLELDVRGHLLPEYLLESAQPDAPCREVWVSAIGFSIAGVPAEGDFFDLWPLRADGQVWSSFFEESGYWASSTEAGEDGLCTVTGTWAGDSPAAVGFLDLEALSGLRIDGIDYLFVQ